MSYDTSFDQIRLDQLANQYLSESDIHGQVLFFSESEENRLDGARFKLDASDYEAIKKTGFKHHLVELLDSLLVYRSQHNQIYSSQGIVHLIGNNMTIQWVSIDEFHLMMQ